MNKNHFRTILFLFFTVAWSKNVIAQADYLHWVHQIGGNGNYDISSCVTKDNLGNLFVSGIFSQTVDFNPSSAVYNVTATGTQDAFVVKLDPNGNFIWVKTFGLSGSVREGTNLKIDNQNNLFFGFNFNGSVDANPGAPSLVMNSNLLNDFCLVKLDTSGSYLWSAQFEDGGYTLSPEGESFVSGIFESIVDINPGPPVSSLTPLGNRDAFLVKLNSNGIFEWGKQFGAAGADIVNTHKIELDNEKNILFTGQFHFAPIDFDPGPATFALSPSDSVGYDVFLVKLDSVGNFKWVKQFPATYEAFITSMRFTLNNDIIFTLTNQLGLVDLDPSPSTLNFQSQGSWDASVCKMDKNGNLLWAKIFAGQGGESFYDMCFDSQYNLYCALTTIQSTTDLDPGPGVVNVTTSGETEGIIIKLDTLGNYVWSKRFINNDNLIPYSIHTQGNNLYLAGGFSGTADFDPNTTTYNLSGNGIDGFLLKLSSTPLFSQEVGKKESTLYPNPTTTEIRIKNNQYSDVKLLNSMGQVVSEVHFTQKQELITVDLSNHPSGIYYLQLKQGNITHTEKVIKK